MFGKEYWQNFAEGALSGGSSGLLAQGLNFLGGLQNEFFDKRAIQRQVEASKELTDYSFEKQMEFWNAQNAYNDPSSQVSRLIRAGLNPAMLNGNAINNTAGNLSSVPQAAAPHGSNHQGTGAPQMAMLMQIAQGIAQTGFLDEETRLITQKIVSELFEQNIKKFAALTGMEEWEIRKLDRIALHEALYEKSLTGGPVTIKNNPVKVTMEDVRQRAEYNKALTNSENALRELKQEQIKQNIEESKSLVLKLSAEEKKILRESESISQIVERQAIVNACSAFYGFPVYDLPPTLRAQLVETYTLVVRGDIYPETALRSAGRLINEYKEKELHIPRTRSESVSRSESSGILSVKASKSSQNSWSETY